MESPTSAFAALLVLLFFIGLGWLIVAIAKRRRLNCNWDNAQVNAKLRLGWLGIVFAVAMLMIRFGLGFHLVFWFALYQVALATYRKKDLAAGAKSAQALTHSG
jgi:hypothetical protein